MVQDFLFEINLIDLFIFSNTEIMYVTLMARKRLRTGYKQS